MGNNKRKRIWAFLLVTILSVSSILRMDGIGLVVVQAAESWSAWQTTPVTASATVKVETKTQYRSRNKERTTSNTTGLSGWTYESEEVTGYGNWGEWTTAYHDPGLSEELKGESRVTHYEMMHWCTGYNSDPKLQYQTSYGKFNEIAVRHSLGTVVDPYSSGYYFRETLDGYAGFLYGGSDKSTCYRCSNTCFTWYAIPQYEWCYSYRSILYTYHYYRWGEYSDWSDTKITASDDVEVETRTLYRYQNVGTTNSGNISSCTITLSASSYTYDGTAKKPGVTVKDGSTSLTNGTHYSVSYADNTNAGTATVTVTGKGTYSGSAKKTFTINKSSAGLSFASSSVSKKTSDGSFTNKLTKKTSASVSYTSSNTGVASVSSTGTVTIKGAGTATITAKTSATSNYAAGSASYQVTVTKATTTNTDSSGYKFGENTYSFLNFGDSDSAGGHCFGMSATSGGYYLGLLKLSNVGISDSHFLYRLTGTSIVKKPICYYQALQGGASANSTVAGGSGYLTGINNIEKDWKEVINYVKSHNYDNKGRLQIGYRGPGGGHAINFLYYKNVNGQDRIYAYDNNFPDTETYFAMSYGQLHQYPKATFSSIYCMALRDINKYFSLVKSFDTSKIIYGDPDEILIPNIKGQPMDGTSLYMYECEDGMESVSIIPLKDNAVFTYMEKEYSFGEITEDTYGEFSLATSDQAGESSGSLSVNNTGRESIYPCSNGHTWESAIVTVSPTCTTSGIITYTCTACQTATKTEVIPATGEHNFNIIPAKEPTASETGNNAYYQCTTCGKCLKTDKETETTVENETVEQLLKNTITASSKVLNASSLNQSYTIGAKVNGGVKLSYKSNNKSITVSSSGKVTIAKNFAGTATITISSAKNATYDSAVKTITVTVKKLTQPMTVSPFAKTWKVAVVKKKAQSFNIVTKKAQGKVSYQSNNKAVLVDSKGKVTIKKGTKKGTYKITVTANGAGIYEKGSKLVTVFVQ